MKANTEIRRTDEYHDGEKWGRVPSWMVGRFVAKRTEKKFRRPKKKRHSGDSPP